MLSACSWEGTALQQEPLTAHIHWARAAPRDWTARPRLPWAARCWGQGSGQKRRQDRCTGNVALGATQGQVLPQTDRDLLDEAQVGWLIYGGWQKAGTLESLVNKSGS